MARIERTIEVSTDRQTVWARIADLDHVEDWNPNVEASACRGDTGLGAIRTCVLTGGGQIDEVVSEWEEQIRIEFAIGSHGAIRSADMGFELEDVAGGTRITAAADYHLMFGPLGPVIDAVVVKRQIARMLDNALAGLSTNLGAHINTPKEKS